MYPGMLATEDINQREVIVQAPSKLIMNTKKAYYSVLNSIFVANPDVFGGHTHEGDDNVMYAFMLYHLQLKEKSEYYQMIQMWPTDPDILCNWDEDTLEELQDPTLAKEAEKQFSELMESWNKLYEVLSKHTDMFKPSSITFNKYKFVFIVSASRTFSSNWEGVSQIVPFCDLINHEMVNCTYDCRDLDTGECIQIHEEVKKQEEQEKKKQEEIQKTYLTELKDDIILYNEQLIDKGLVKTPAEEM